MRTDSRLRTRAALVAAAAIGALATGASLAVNNAGLCCDMLYFAGFPAPFYGGSGGFVARAADRLWPAALAVSYFWWFGLALATVLVVARARRAAVRPLAAGARLAATLAVLVGVGVAIATGESALVGGLPEAALTAVALVVVVVAVAIAIGSRA